MGMTYLPWKIQVSAREGWRFTCFSLCPTQDYTLISMVLRVSCLGQDFVIIPDNNVHGPTWSLPRSCRPQVGPMLAPWNLPSQYKQDPRQWTLGVSICMLAHTLNINVIRFAWTTTEISSEKPAFTSMQNNQMLAMFDVEIKCNIITHFCDGGEWWGRVCVCVCGGGGGGGGGGLLLLVVVVWFTHYSMSKLYQNLS